MSKLVDLNDPNLNLVTLNDGTVISQRVADLIETIYDTWEGRVQVAMIPGRALKPDEYQFCILEVNANGEFPFMWIKDESEFTGEILERIFKADNSKGDVLTEMQARNAAVRALQDKLFKDKMGEAHDIMYHALRSPLNTYVVPGGAKIRDFGNRIK